MNQISDGGENVLGNTGASSGNGLPGVGQDTDIGSRANGVLPGTFGNGDSAITVAAGDGATQPAGAGTLGDGAAGVSLGNGLGVGNLVDVNALDNSGSHSVSTDAGADGGSPIAALGALTIADNTSPVSVVGGSGPNVADASLLGDSNVLQNAAGPLTSALGPADGSVVSGNAGQSGDTPIASAGVLQAATSDSPVNLDAAHGSNLAGVGALGSAGNSVAALDANGGDTGLGSVANIAAVNDSSGHVVELDGGAAGGSPVAVAGIMTDADTSSPINALVGNGQNIADASLLSDTPLPQSTAGPLSGVLGSSNDSVVSTDAGSTSGSPLASASVLATPSSEAPVAADVLTGTNAATASLVGNGDTLNFPNLGGAGTDSLGGVASPLPTVGAPGIAEGDGAAAGNPLVDIGHDGSLIQVHNDPSSVIGLDHAALV